MENYSRNSAHERHNLYSIYCTDMTVAQFEIETSYLFHEPVIFSGFVPRGTLYFFIQVNPASLP